MFLKDFLMISDLKTIILLFILAICFYIIYRVTKKKASFGKRVTIAMIIGIVLGLGIQFVCGFPDQPDKITYIKEATTWYGLFGNGFISLIRMLVIPLVMISIIQVIITMAEGVKIGSLIRKTIAVTMITVSISAIVGLAFGVIFGVGKGMNVDQGTAKIKEVSSVVQTLSNLIPANPVQSMVDLNIIGLVVFSMFIGLGAKRMHKRYPEIIQPFYDLTIAFHKIIISMAITIIKLMPYAVIPLLANTIALRGLASIRNVGLFIVVLYLAAAVMFILQILQLILFGVNPVMYLKKGLQVMVMAFTSRSSVGTLPVTIKCLSDDLGVNHGTASFVASFGSTAGMQGCAGVFPSLLIIFVCNMNGTEITIPFLLMSTLVIALGSLGIAGIPGTATMAASVSLSGTGMSSSFPLVSPILAIDPLIDMGRTLINVTGAMVNSITVDKLMGTFDYDAYLASPKEKKETVGEDL